MPNALVYQRILLIDNRDSFTYNLVDYCRRLGAEVVVYRNTTPLEVLDQLEFDLLLLSPGPSVPGKAGNLLGILAHFIEKKPVLGICLGHQAIVELCGGSLEVVPAVHGKSDHITHDRKTVFAGLPQPMEVARYHSIAAKHIPPELEVTARSSDGTVMAVRHRFLPVEGVQFHPESVLTAREEAGFRLLKNVLAGKLGSGFPQYAQLMYSLQEARHIEQPVLAAFVDAVLQDRLTEEQKLAALVALAFRLKQPYYLREFIDLLAARSPMAPVPSLSAAALDICGTGGSGLPRLNTSTLAALLLSGLGVPLVKHGNKAASGRFGSFDFLEAMGVPLDSTPKDYARVFQKTKLAFVFGQVSHPALAHFVRPRSQVGVPTIFNVLGPLLNPYKPKQQLIGTAFPQYMELLLETAILLNTTHVCVVRGGEGLDEVSVSAPTRVLRYRDGRKSAQEISPRVFGLPDALPFEAVSVLRPSDSIRIAEALFAGERTTPHYALVAANAAFVYHEFVDPIGLAAAFDKMVAAIDAGLLGQQFAAYKQILTAQTLPA